MCVRTPTCKEQDQPLGEHAQRGPRHGVDERDLKSDGTVRRSLSAPWVVPDGKAVSAPQGINETAPSPLRKRGALSRQWLRGSRSGRRFSFPENHGLQRVRGCQARGVVGGGGSGASNDLQQLSGDTGRFLSTRETAEHPETAASLRPPGTTPVL